jgi:hypothetical protein
MFCHPYQFYSCIGIEVSSHTNYPFPLLRTVRYMPTFEYIDKNAVEAASWGVTVRFPRVYNVPVFEMYNEPTFASSLGCL